MAAPLFAPGRMDLGCNYWASHAGAFMWRDWQLDVVDRDLAALAAAGLTWLRVFPLWPDFQPIQLLRGQGGAPIEMRHGEDPLPFDPIGQAGLSAFMLDRFAAFCDMADRHGLHLVVGLITGWMSGRLFVPPALVGRDPITDPLAITWQVRYVTGFVTRLRDHPAIAAWDLGNECNCMGNPSSPEAAFVWTAAIANAIRVADATRPIVSGMHSLSTPFSTTGNPWLIDDQGALTDVLTTHPYPYWVRHTNTDPVNALRTTLHATAESRFYSDISGKPCIAEEIGTMGPMIASDDVSAGFARVNMLSLWANDCRAMAWWCAHDQTGLSPAPYDWNGVELELGLLRNDGTPKPALREMTAMRGFLDNLPFPALPRPRTEAICLLTRNQDDWATAYSTYILAKQAKVEIAFRHIGQDIPEAPLYLLPSLRGANCLPRHIWLDLLDRVRRGATLYMSLRDGILPGFDAATGVQIQTRAKAAGPLSMTLADGTVLGLPGGDDLHITANGAAVLGHRTDTGGPAWWTHRLGAGEVQVLTAPIEQELTFTPRAFDGDDALPYWRIYATAARSATAGRLLAFDDPALAVTEHPMEDGSVLALIINHTTAPRSSQARLQHGATLSGVLRGTATAGHGGLKITTAGLDGALIRLSRSV
jgi:hypothetical protein